MHWLGYNFCFKHEDSTLVQVCLCLTWELWYFVLSKTWLISNINWCAAKQGKHLHVGVHNDSSMAPPRQGFAKVIRLCCFGRSCWLVSRFKISRISGRFLVRIVMSNCLNQINQKSTSRFRVHDNCHCTDKQHALSFHTKKHNANARSMFIILKQMGHAWINWMSYWMSQPCTAFHTFSLKHFTYSLNSTPIHTTLKR